MGMIDPSHRDGGASRGQLLAWAFYDWANASFVTLIQTFVFANYFTRQIAVSKEAGQTQWALAIGGAGVAVALTGPLFGAIADQSGRRKPWIATLTAIAVASAAGMWFVEPDSPAWSALVLVAVGTFGVEGANIFYNAMLPALARRDQVGRWSGWGWALGYLGGLLCLVIALVALVGWTTGSSWIPGDNAMNVRASFLLVAVWFAAFSLPLLLITPDATGPTKPLGRAARDGLKQLVDSVRQVRRFAFIIRFLIARLFYIDGLASIFAIGGVFASGVFGMDAQRIIMFGIALNVTAGLGAFGLSWVDDWIGGKWTIALSLVGIIIPGIVMVVAPSELWFWVAGLVLGIFVGPVQSASRSYMARVAPPQLRTQGFGLYALSGKATAFAVPLLVSAVTDWTGSQRWGMTPILVFLALGLAILLTVPAASEAPAAESHER